MKKTISTNGGRGEIMIQTRITETVYVFCIYVLKLVYLNLLWFLFTLLGLGIFGIFPATVALCKIQQQWLTQKNESSPIFILYWQEYKQNFLRVNMLAITLIVIGFIIYFDLRFFVQKGGMLNQIISLGIYILSVWYLIVLMYILPTYTTYHLKLHKYIQYAFIIGMLNPLKTLGLAVAAGGCGRRNDISIFILSTDFIFGGGESNLFHYHECRWSSYPAGHHA